MHAHMLRRSLPFALAFAGCHGDATTAVGDSGSTTTHDTSSTSETTASETSSASASTTAPSPGSSESGGEGPTFDVGALDTSGGGETGPIVPSCKVEDDDIDADQPCSDVAPPDSFTPDVQWAWAGSGGDTDVLGTPVVANLTDDNGDGAIDLCDIPDVVVLAYTGPVGSPGHIHVLSGDDGSEHFSIPDDLQSISYPALGDLDGDGIPEIVAATSESPGPGHLVAFHHDGSLLWASDDATATSSFAISLADLDADGDVEIIFAGAVFDHEGTRLWQATPSYLNTAADLDDDGDLEVITGGSAFHHDGSLYWSGFDQDGHPHVADLDLDGVPEVMFVGPAGISIAEHDGTHVVTNQVPGLAAWRPAAVHDMDGDGAPEIAVGGANTYSVLEVDLGANWTAAVTDFSGFAAGTAFDFLGDGTAEAMYADEVTLFVFDENGDALLETPRSSLTQWENPIVVDVDNDGSAEIVVVSNAGTSPPVQVIRDVEDRWIPARRIWNEHDYHVTNVREDGTIPQVQPKSWDTLNTFRTQAQIGAAGGVCMPVPRG